MINLETLETSYNRITQKKIIVYLDEIDNANREYLLAKYNYRTVFFETKGHAKRNILKDKALIKEFYAYKREKRSVVLNEYKQRMEDAKSDHSFIVEEAKREHRALIEKIKTNYKHTLSVYKKEGRDSAELKSNFSTYYEQKLLQLDKTLSHKLIVETQRFDEEIERIKALKQKSLDEIATSYQKLQDEDYVGNLRKDILKEKKILNDAKVTKYMMKEINYHESLPLKERLNDIKKINRQKINKLNQEADAYYKSLSKSEKKEYRYIQKYVNEDYRNRHLQKADEIERRIFKKINPAYLYVGPAGLSEIFFTVLPFIFMLIAAFFKVNLTTLSKSKYVGLRNFISIFTKDIEFQKALSNTVIYAFITFVLLTIVSVLMAMWLSKNTRIHNLAQTMVFTPHIASLVSISILWIAILNPNGILNKMLALFGIEGPGWLIQENTSLLSVSFVTVWKDIGYYVLIIIAGLQAIPSYVYEAAQLDKSSKTTTFFKITLPLLLPTLTFVFVTKFINSFKVFAPIEIMTNGGPMGSSMVLSYWVYKVGRVGYNYGTAMAGAIILTIMIAICTFLNLKFLSNKEKK